MLTCSHIVLVLVISFCQSTGIHASLCAEDLIMDKLMKKCGYYRHKMSVSGIVSVVSLMSFYIDCDKSRSGLNVSYF